MLEGLKSPFNRLLSPLAASFARAGVHPNLLTLTGLVFALVAAVFAGNGAWKTACLLTAAGALLDSLDGLLARISSLKSDFGAILDSSCDRLTEIFLLFGILVFYSVGPVAGLRTKGILFSYSAITMSMMVSYIRARCEGVGVPCTRGVLQRPERIILLCIGLFFGPAVMVWVLAGLSVFSGITVLERFAQAYQGTRSDKVTK